MDRSTLEAAQNDMLPSELTVFFHFTVFSKGSISKTGFGGALHIRRNILAIEMNIAKKVLPFPNDLKGTCFNDIH
jgi:hypothetical protein